MEYIEFKELLFKKAKNSGFKECEIYYNDKESLSISIYEGEVEKYSLEKSKGVSFRGKINSKMGYSYTEILDLKAVDMLINNAKESLMSIDTEDEEFIYEGDTHYSNTKTYNRELENLDPKFLIETAIQIEKEAKKYKEVINIQSCKLVYNTLNKRINNSKHIDLNQKYNQLMAYIVPVVGNEEEKEDGTGYIITRDIKNIDPSKIAQQGVESALEKLNAKTIKSGKYKAIIHNEAMADLLETFAQVFNADVAQKKMSLLADKENQIIGSNNLTIIDNPLLEDGVSSSSFDDEGVRTYKKEIVSKGKLNTLLYNLKTAKKANKKSTGNGYKSSYKSAVNVDCTNLYIQEGNNSLQDLMNYISEGVMITSLAGLHAGANAVSGDFSLAAKGFYIKEGKKQYPIEQITIAGNYFDLLKDIELIANDTVFPLSNIGSPSVVIRDIAVAGK